MTRPLGRRSMDYRTIVTQQWSWELCECGWGMVSFRSSGLNSFTASFVVGDTVEHGPKIVPGGVDHADTVSLPSRRKMGT